MFFVQLAEGVDDETWDYRLRKGDFSRWFRQSIKDDDLAASMKEIEKKGLSPAESRALVKKIIEERYTLPA